MKEIIAICILITVFISCEDAFETVLEIDPPPHEPLLVLESEVNYGDTVALIRVSKSIGILDEVSNHLEYNINDAEVFFKVNNMSYPVENLEDFTFYNYKVNLEEGVDVGDLITIEVTHPSYPTASVIGTIPEFVGIESAVFFENGGLDTEGDQRSKVEVTLNDPPGNNFYAIRILTEMYNSEPQPTHIQCIDPAASESHHYYILLVEDSSFDGETKTFDFLLYPMTAEDAEGTVFVEWMNISEAYFKYSKTRDKNDEAEDNPFASPTTIWTNVDNGLGILSTVNRRNYLVD